MMSRLWPPQSSMLLLLPHLWQKLQQVFPSLLLLSLRRPLLR
jgi:hypothetical protein